MSADVVPEPREYAAVEACLEDERRSEVRHETWRAKCMPFRSGSSFHILLASSKPDATVLRLRTSKRSHSRSIKDWVKSARAVKALGRK